MSVRNTVKSIQDIMRQDAGVDGDAQRISQLCWMFFLGHMPEIARKKVDFPEPEGPVRSTGSLGASLRLAPSTISRPSGSRKFSASMSRFLRAAWVSALAFGASAMTVT